MNNVITNTVETKIKEKIVYHPDIEGLGVITHPSGSKTIVLDCKAANENTNRIFLGECIGLSTAECMSFAKKGLKQSTKGHDINIKVDFNVPIEQIPLDHPLMQSIPNWVRNKNRNIDFPADDEINIFDAMDECLPVKTTPPEPLPPAIEAIDADIPDGKQETAAITLAT